MKSNIYYSVYHCLYDNIDSRDSVLSDIRKKYFETGLEIKNKVAKEIDSVTYKYSYHLKYGQPLKWKKMVGEKLLEKSQPDGNGGYKIITYGEHKKAIKIRYYSLEHEWIRSEYFAKNEIKKIPSVILMPDDEYDKIKICYRDNGCNCRDIEVVKCDLNIDIKDIDLYSKRLGFEYLVCYTYEGVFFYCEGNVKEKIINLNNKAINNIEDSTVEDTVNLEEDGKSVDKEIKFTEKDKIKYLNEENKENLNCNFEEEHYFYVGETKNNLRDGRGRTSKLNGKTIYEGAYKNGKRNGFGSLYYTNDKLCYVGNWKNNKRDGLGVSFNDNQNVVHVGTWKDDKLDGVGTKFDEFGNIVFSGTLNSGKINGAGIRYNLENKSYIVEQWNNGNLKNKFTEFSAEGKLLYYGEMEHFKRQGYGIQYNDNGGIIYEGYWVDNCYNGKGTILYNDHKYTGLFENSKPCGKGVIYKNDGTTIQGIFLSCKTENCDTIKFENDVEYYFIPSV